MTAPILYRPTNTYQPWTGDQDNIIIAAARDDKTSINEAWCKAAVGRTLKAVKNRLRCLKDKGGNYGYSHRYHNEEERSRKRAAAFAAHQAWLKVEWPKVTTTPADAFEGKRFDDVPAVVRSALGDGVRVVIVPGRYPRPLLHSPMGCAAAMCTGG